MIEYLADIRNAWLIMAGIVSIIGSAITLGIQIGRVKTQLGHLCGLVREMGKHFDNYMPRHEIDARMAPLEHHVWGSSQPPPSPSSLRPPL